MKVVKVKVEFDYIIRDPDADSVASVEAFIIEWVQEEFNTTPNVTLTEIESE